MRSMTPPPPSLGDKAYSSLILSCAFCLIIYVISKSNCETFTLPSKSHKHKNKNKK